MEITQVIHKPDHVENYYNWSNEHSSLYERLFAVIENPPVEVVSVGGGDHILFSLCNFDSIKAVHNVDVSPSSLICSLIKLSVLRCGTYGEWAELCHGSIWSDTLEGLLKECGTLGCIVDLVATSKSCSLEGLVSGLGGQNPNRGAFLSRDTFRTLRDRVQKIERFCSVLRDIWTLDILGLQLSKDPADMFLLSNAYASKSYVLTNNTLPPFVDRSLKIGGYILSTDHAVSNHWSQIDRVHCNKSENDMGGWPGYVFRRIK